jgi:peptidoglycan/xylan/chitin deacetylase (PgdA/CDA1 family)
MPWGSFVRNVVKAAAANALHYSGLQQLLSRASRIAAGGRRVLILSYHRVVEDFEREAAENLPGLLVGRETFARHLDELERTKFDLVSLSQALEVISGRLEARRDIAVITFDDGYRDVYDHAFPILARRGLSATVYLATGLVGTSKRFAHDRLFSLVKRDLAARRAGRRNLDLATAAAQEVDRLIATWSTEALAHLMAGLEQRLRGEALPPGSGEPMTWEMVSKMASAGIEFGAHTVDHLVLTHESDATVEWQIAESKRAIEQRIGRPVVSFAYPNGYYDRRLVRALLRHGFRSAVTTEDLPNQVGIDLFRLRRKTIWENYSRGPFGYSSALISCHLDDVFTMLSLTRPVLGEREEPTRHPDSDDPLSGEQKGGLTGRRTAS